MSKKLHEPVSDDMERAHRLLGLNVIVIGAVMGMGVKILPVPVVDEIALYAVCAGYLMRFGRYELRYPVHNLLFLYLAFLSVLGLFMKGNINTVRTIFLAFGMLLLVNAKKKYSLNNALLVITAYAYLITTIILPVVGSVLNLMVAWWQDWLWTGTAYSAFGVFVSGMIIVYRTESWSGIVALMLILFSGILNESRLTMLYFYILAIFMMRRVFKKYLADFWNLRIKKSFLLVLGVIALVLLMNTGGLIDNDFGDRLSAAFRSANNTLKGGNDDSDQGRKDQDEVVLNLMQENPLHFVFGAGWLTHQKDMLEYGIKADRTSTLVRPTGIPAMFFDGGMILFFLVMWCAFETGCSAWKSVEDRGERLWFFILPFLSIMTLFVTNLFDATLFWLTLVPGFYPNLLIARNNHKI